MVSKPKSIKSCQLGEHMRNLFEGGVRGGEMSPAQLEAKEDISGRQSIILEWSDLDG